MSKLYDIFGKITEKHQREELIEVEDINVIADRIFCIPIDVPTTTKTKSGLLVVQEAKKGEADIAEAVFAKVIYVGELVNAHLEGSTRKIKEGDYILSDKYAGRDLTFGSNSFRVYKYSDVLGFAKIKTQPKIT